MNYNSSILTWADICTLTSLVFGLMTVVGVALGYEYAILALLGSVVCDRADGWIARKLGVTGLRGYYLDALCDACNFCFVPACCWMIVCLQNINLNGLRMMGIVASLRYACCGVYRLARFLMTSMDTVHIKASHYTGLPVTAATCIFVIIRGVGQYWGGYQILTIGTFSLIVLGYMMVSTYAIPKL